MSDLVRLVQAASRIAIVVHVDPDPDAVGSALGLALALDALGKEVVLLCDDPVPSEVRFLPGVDRFVNMLPAGVAPDLLISVDTSDAERLGKVAEPLLRSGIPVINIDHHVTNLQFGAINLVATECASAAELMLQVVEALGVPLSKEISTCLLAGLVGDTRSFSTPSVTSDTLAVASRLVAAGAELHTIVELVFNRKTVETLRLWGLALTKVCVENGLIWVSLPYAERLALGLNVVSEKGLSNLLLNAEAATISAVFTEQSDGRVIASFRAKPGYDVASVALTLGGGGHQLAAGCTIDGPLDQAVERVLALLKGQAAAPQRGEE